MNLSGYQKQACPPKKVSGRRAKAGNEAKIRMAPFFERRLFYLISELCYKRM